MPPELPYVFTFPTTFYEWPNEIHQEPGLLPLVRGQGVLWGDGKRYRVADSWLSFDRHGQFDIGMHVFLERVEEGSEDDTLGLARPSYFGL